MSSFHQGFGLKKPAPAKAPEKSSFAHTCNLLSQYVKEKGSLKDLNLVGIAGKTEATGSSNVTNPAIMNLLSNIENKVESSMQLPKPADSFPRLSTAVPEEGVTEAKRSQMTIFYGGQVLVFDNLAADKAREVMQLASDGSSSGYPAAAGAEEYHSADAVAYNSRAAPPVSAQERPQPQAEANTSDLPIARRSSLHRFLEKRKDRAVARGPYHQVQNAPASSSSKNEEQLELKL